MIDSPHLLVRLDRGDAAVIEVDGHLEPDGLLRLAALVRRTQALAARVVVDVAHASPGRLTADLLDELSHGRQGCAPFDVQGVPHQAGAL